MDNDWGPLTVELEEGEREIGEDGVKRVPVQTKRKLVSDGFTHYDTSGGYCAFCGRLTCRGTCFK